MEAGLEALINRKSDNYEDFYENELYPDVIEEFSSKHTGIPLADVRAFLNILGCDGTLENDLYLEPLEMDAANASYFNDIKSLPLVDMSSVEFEVELASLEVKYANQIDADALVAYSSVAINSFNYWNANTSAWVENSIPPSDGGTISANRIDVGEVIKADISGAITGAIGGAILGGNALPGAMIGAEYASIVNMIVQIIGG